ncbi:hypothetical protein [Streptomyces sp. NPDC059278]|uniref:hypothetical protein n=1 Tax=Streptomyces sp. NPDC059278 TaxID=3346801 RepID=UPI00368440E8
MTTSRNEETAAASEPEAHATAEAAAGETPARTARAASAKGSGTAAAAEPSSAPGEAAAGKTSEESAETAASTGAAAESTAKGESEQEQKQESEAEAAGAKTTGAAATTEGESEAATATAESEGEAATATATAEADAEAEATATMTATTTADAPEKTGRPNKALLAGAAIAGVLLVTVPFLVHTGGGNDGKRSAGSGEAPGTMLGAGNGDVPGAFASAAPSPRAGSGKQPPAGKDGKGGSGPSADGVGASKPLNEGGGSTGGDSGDAGDTGGKGDGSGGGKSTGGEKSTARKTTTGSGSASGGSGSGGATGGTAQKSAPQSTVVYTGVTGHGCPTPSGGGFQQDHYFTDGSAGWYTRPSGGWTGNGCNGSYSSIPMSGDTSTDMQNRVKWWWKPGTRARTCQISVFIPNSNTNLYVGGHPTKYHVLVNANDRTTMYSSFSINQVAHRGQWVDAGTFAMKGATIGVKLLDRGDDWSKGWEKAHHAAAQMRATCRS